MTGQIRVHTVSR